MIELEEVKTFLLSLKPKIEFIEKTFKIENLDKEFLVLENKSNELGFWSNYEENKEVIERLKYVKNTLAIFKKIQEKFNDTIDLIEICDSENDISFIDEIKNSVNEIKSDIESQILISLLNSKHDENNAILTIHSGAGGTESQDWVEMMFKMYSKWADKHKMKLKILNFLDGEEAGFKNISAIIEGENAYGLLKGENGVHRLVRISPFDSSGRRHTSFAAVEIIPDLDNKIKIDIPTSEIKVDVFRASGAGGQHVNKTSSAVRITHIPTNIVVVCQNERSQFQNKESALKILKSKLYQIKECEKLENIKDIKGVQKEISWGSQIRSYIFMPYTMVKDHRTKTEVSNIDAVMNGDIDVFIYAYLEHIL
ncbi:MAG: peptide chain release factor 2 [Candidatus Improbicoccus pseudotrichonymphae]|uniref:Peptide chain release factor 2 n=1 Tax=Candidatus Improbicoccus pseudotrichonymphae TaxID=3033792 RepID=A0AA48I0K8_9FIRM|nr:MAG: peptide chain release factor 2 [Candidatus Improbicoccus pseudotrichonymphae]